MYKIRSVKFWFTVIITIYCLVSHWTGKLDSGNLVLVLSIVLPFYFATNTASKFANKTRTLVSDYINEYSKKE